MQASMFNVRVPLASGDVFLMNTFSDGQIIVSPDVVTVLDRLSDGSAPPALNDEERALVNELTEHGFVVADRAAERQKLGEFFHNYREDRTTLRVTVLTTLQCNFACDYCFQGDHGDYNKFAHKMTLETSARVADWIEDQLDAIRPEHLAITFFGGEPLLNLPVMYDLAERCGRAAGARGVELKLSIITNGLLLTREVVDRLLPFGLMGVKITLDGDRVAHDRMRPLRGGQGTFDRIVDNVRKVADRVPITIGGNFDESSVDSYPALLDFLKEQDFAGAVAKVAFKPIIRAPHSPKGTIPLTLVDADDARGAKPLGGTCMTSAGAGGLSGGAGSPCDSCHFVDEKMSFLREETKRRGFPTPDGVHMGPCQIHKRHAHTIGPDGSLYACPGFTGELTQSVGHIDGRHDEARHQAAARFEALAGWKQCGDCSFIPVCGGGCSVAAHTELGDMNAPSCHKPAFESALVSLAADAASVS
jgi:uncharacterized protein